MATEQQTGMIDEHYDVVSVLYHALQGADVCNTYIQDAEKEGDAEGGQFFREVQDQYRNLANKAKELLLKRIR